MAGGEQLNPGIGNNEIWRPRVDRIRDPRVQLIQDALPEIVPPEVYENVQKQMEISIASRKPLLSEITEMDRISVNTAARLMSQRLIVNQTLIPSIYLEDAFGENVRLLAPNESTQVWRSVVFPAESYPTTSISLKPIGQDEIIDGALGKKTFFPVPNGILLEQSRIKALLISSSTDKYFNSLKILQAILTNMQSHPDQFTEDCRLIMAMPPVTDKYMSAPLAVAMSARYSLEQMTTDHHLLPIDILIVPTDEDDIYKLTDTIVAYVEQLVGFKLYSKYVPS